jgi:hypothetical protein
LSTQLHYDIRSSSIRVRDIEGKRNSSIFYKIWICLLEKIKKGYIRILLEKNLQLSAISCGDSVLSWTGQKFPGWIEYDESWFDDINLNIFSTA